MGLRLPSDLKRGCKAQAVDTAPTRGAPPTSMRTRGRNSSCNCQCEIEKAIKQLEIIGNNLNKIIKEMKET